MNANSVNLLVREIASIVSSAFDPNPVLFRPADEVGVGPVRRTCLKPLEAPHRLRIPLNRLAFLVVCMDFTEDETVEHLIIGLRSKYGATTTVGSIVHRLNTTKSNEAFSIARTS